MIRRQRRGRERVRAAEVVLRVDRIVRHLADDAEVVQRVGEVRMVGAEGPLLQDGHFAQELLGRRVAAGRGRLFGAFDERAGVLRFRHPVQTGSDGREEEP